jgi:pyruvate,water dikinase
LIEFDKQDADLQAEINERITGYASPVAFYVDKIAEGVATLAASVYPRKKSLCACLISNQTNTPICLAAILYEPHEENPMLGFRGAARYVSPMISKIALRWNAKRSNACAMIWGSPTLKL